MIQCQSCLRSNQSEATSCQGCGAKLLPGISFRARGKYLLKAGLILVGGLLASLAIAGMPYLLATESPPPESAEKIFTMFRGAGMAAALVVLYLTARVGRKTFVPTPTFEKYFLRAKRHKDVDPEQASLDATMALEIM